MTRVAAVDCGTNSIRLLVADIDATTGAFTTLDRRMEIVRLGQGVDRTGRLAPEALERTLAACGSYAEAISARGVTPDRTRFIATSASRDAQNRDEFAQGVRHILGVNPEVITGDEEAQLSYTGATRELVPERSGRGYLVLDIGGGSTEFVLGDDVVRAARSVDIGCVRLTERHLRPEGTLIDPPGEERVAAMRADITASMDRAEESVPLSSGPRLVGLAGSVTTVAGLALGLREYDASTIHHARITRHRVAEVTGWLLGSNHTQRAEHPVIHPGRIDVLGAGALVLQSVMERTGADDVLVSEHDILDGAAYSIVEHS